MESLLQQKKSYGLKIVKPRYTPILGFVYNLEKNTQALVYPGQNRDFKEILRNGIAWLEDRELEKTRKIKTLGLVYWRPAFRSKVLSLLKIYRRMKQFKNIS